jgi:uncharacterized protein YcbX
MKTVSKIIIYPIKSLNGISVQSAKLTPTGFINDRRFMLVDVEENKMITLREFPALYKLQVSQISNDFIQVENKNGRQKPLLIHLNETVPFSDIKKVRVWDDQVTVQSVNDEADEWFSKELEIHCQLVQMAPNSFRQVDLTYAPPGQGVLFSDGFPFLICTEASLDLLNKELVRKVSMLHFRPNIVIRGTTPNEEYDWESIQINETIFSSFKPCARCQIISIYPESSEINEEILPMMAKKFNRGKKIIFGINACWQYSHDYTVLKVGDILNHALNKQINDD